jgi:hypothetical protein
VPEKEEREITVLVEATTYAMQPVCNAAWAAHALGSTNNTVNRGLSLTVISHHELLKTINIAHHVPLFQKKKNFVCHAARL